MSKHASQKNEHLYLKGISMPMTLKGLMQVFALSFFGVCSLLISTASAQQPTLPREKLAADNFGADAPWFLKNIPFFEIDDAEIQQIYYYRWKLYRSHIREIGSQGTTVLEFLDNVPWARQPYTDLNDSASFHLLEGRWLRDPRVVDDLVDHLYSGGANDRHFSESIAAATVSSTLVTGDVGPALRHLDTMQYIYNLWDDHFDRERGLYWIEPLLDATEYTISSIDASGAGFEKQPSMDQNHNGFTGGQAFRPSINSYQFANAMAIAQLAGLAGKPQLATEFTERAEKIRSAVLGQLWNPSLQHFTDIYQRSTGYVQKGEFIRGRELVGYLPWFYELPPRQASGSMDYSIAWSHLLSGSELAGAYGMRTVEPSYPRYLAQYRYDRATGKPECEWNGPSWPFQNSQALTALANLLDDYPQAGITRADYLHLLRQYTHQHFLSAGYPDLQEDYDPDTGKPIVGLARSNHYNHSTYIDLILSGLIGVRPRADQTLELDPLVPTQVSANDHPIRFFAVQGLAYHGHEISIFYDADANRYHAGRGLSVFVDGKRAFGPGPLAHTEIVLAKKPVAVPSARRVDLAVNVGDSTGPTPAASSSMSPSSVMEAIDGRLWFFPENPNGWSPLPSDRTPNYSLHFAQGEKIATVELYFFANGRDVEAPLSFQVQLKTPAGWVDVPDQKRSSQKPLANGANIVTFPEVSVQDLRIVLTQPAAPATLRLIELKAFDR